MGINGRFQMVDSTFGYNKTYARAKLYINKTFIHIDRITNKQKEDLAETFKISFREVNEIIYSLI